MTAVASTVHSQASINVRAVVLPRAKWDTAQTAKGLAFLPQKGTWYGHVIRDGHDVNVVAMIACPNCGGTLYLSHDQAAAKALRRMTGMPVPVAHTINHLGMVSPDVLCQHGRCDFHRKVYLDRWNKTKPLYAIAYIEGEHGEIKIDYCHAIDRREARLHFGPRRNVRIIDIGPAVGFFVNERTGRITAD